MLGEATITSTIAVKDIDKAKAFYGATLGLQQTDEDGEGVHYRSGNGGLYIYKSQYAGTNQATYASWDVGDIEAVVDELKGKGVNFEHYDLPNTTREGDVHVLGSEKAAWFKDPDGNILAVSSKT